MINIHTYRIVSNGDIIVIRSRRQLWDGAVIQLFGTLYFVNVLIEAVPNKKNGEIELLPHSVINVEVI